MAGKKIWAYAKDKRTNNYVKGTRHKHRLYFIWEALKLKNDDPVEHGNLEYMSTQRLESDRREVHPHVGGFFRYNSNQPPKGGTNDDPDSDSLSHSLAIAALAELSVLNFECRGEKFSIAPTSVETEQRLQLISEGAYKYYVPDIVFTFDQDSEYAKRWGRKLVVEVMHTHACEGVKIKDFENHGIPIIEVKLNSMTLERHAGTKPPNVEQIRNFYSYLQKIYSKVIYGEIISNPVTADFHRESVAFAFEKLKRAEKQRGEVQKQSESFEKSLQELTSEFTEHKRKVSAKAKEIAEHIHTKDKEIGNFKQRINDVQRQLDQTKKKLEEAEGQLEAEKSKSFWSKLFGL